MRKKYKVNWAGPARLDLVDIAEYIAEENPATARKIVKKIESKIANLYIQPERGRIVPELSNHGITKFRELIFPPWRVLYQIDDKFVLIFLVADGRRNLEDILFRRIMR